MTAHRLITGFKNNLDHTHTLKVFQGTTMRYDLSKPEEVILYLENTPFASDTVTRLTGGNANYLYRLKLRTQYHGRSTFVLKHAKPYLSSAKDFAIAVERQVRSNRDEDGGDLETQSS